MERTQSLDWKGLGVAIKTARSAKVPKLLQPKLAGQLKIPQSSISFAEKGLEGRVSLDRVKLIADAVGVDWTKFSNFSDESVEAEFQWLCDSTSCPGARPVVFDTPEGWSLRFRPYKFEADSNICPLCSEEGLASSDPAAPQYLDGLVPRGYSQILATHSDAKLKEFIDLLAEYRLQLIAQAMDD